MAESLAYLCGEEGGNFLVQMIFTCLPSLRGRGGGSAPCGKTALFSCLCTVHFLFRWGRTRRWLWRSWAPISWTWWAAPTCSSPPPPRSSTSRSRWVPTLQMWDAEWLKGTGSRAVLRIRDVYPGSDFFPSGIRTVSIPDTGSASKNLSILTPKKPKKWVLSSRKYDPGCSSRIRMLTFYPSRIPDPGVKKAPDPGSGSATLVTRYNFFFFLTKIDCSRSTYLRTSTGFLAFKRVKRDFWFAIFLAVKLKAYWRNNTLIGDLLTITFNRHSPSVFQNGLNETAIDF